MAWGRAAYLPSLLRSARIFRRCFLRLCVLIFWRWRFFPEPMLSPCGIAFFVQGLGPLYGWNWMAMALAVASA